MWRRLTAQTAGSDSDRASQPGPTSFTSSASDQTVSRSCAQMVSYRRLLSVTKPGHSWLDELLRAEGLPTVAVGRGLVTA